MKKSTSLSSLHVTSSIIGILIVAFTLFFFVGSLLEGRNKPAPDFPTSLIITFLIWGFGLAGLVLAIWKPGIGGLFSLLSFIVFNLMVVFSPNPESRYSFVLLIFLIPSILFLASWWSRKSKSGL
ncbi:MAG: hypothetical protein WCI31_08555 [Prolixibacteraceae bacterium]